MKKFLAVLLTGALAFSVAACGTKEETTTDAPSNEQAQEQETTEGELTTVLVGASPTPHAEILYAAQDALKEKGIDLQVMEFTDYVQPNLALDGGDLDANYFQHVPYLDSFNQEHGTDLTSVFTIHYEPMGIYAGTTTDLADIPDGAKVGIPADGTNGGRALLLLQDAGVITLNPDAGILATKLDIVENPHNIEVLEMEAAQIPLSLSDLALGVVNGNYAMQNGLATDDALVIEAADSLAAQTYANVFVVKTGAENDEVFATIQEVLNSDIIADYINENYGGAVAPTF